MVSDDSGKPVSGTMASIDIADVLRGMLGRWKLIAGLTVLLALLGGLFAVLGTPVYTSSARVLVEYQDNPYTRSGAAPVVARRISTQDVRSQVEVLKSRDLALKVLKRLKLIGYPEFDRLKRGIGLAGRLKIALGFMPDPRRQTPEQRALDVWNKRLQVYALPESKVIVISYTSRDPRIAAAVANTLAAEYVRQSRAKEQVRTGEARAWLAQQIEALRKKVVAAEVAVERHRSRAGLFKGAQANLENQQLSELSSQITRAAAERSRAEAEARAIRALLKKGAIDSSTAVLNSPLIQRLREQQVVLQRRLAELSTTYLDNHPKVRAVRREMAGLRRQIAAEARKIARALEQRARLAAAREQELRSTLERLKKKVAQSSVDKVRLRELEREARVTRQLLESFLARYNEAAARRDAAVQPAMARLISRAGIPAAPSFPRIGPIMLLSALAGLMIGLGLAFIGAVMAAMTRPAPVERPAPRVAGPARPEAPAALSPSVDDDADARMRAAVARLARQAGEAPAEPRPDADVADEIVSMPASTDSRAVSALAAWVDECQRDAPGLRRVAVAALPGGGAGAGELSVALGRALSGRGRKTLLLDADSSHAAPIERAEAGIAEALSGAVDFARVIRRDDASGLHVIHTGRDRAMLGGEAMQAVLEALDQAYHVILLHEGETGYPLEAAQSILPAAQATVIVAPQGQVDAAEALRDALQRDGAHGVIIAAVEERAAHPAAGIAAQ